MGKGNGFRRKRGGSGAGESGDGRHDTRGGQDAKFVIYCPGTGEMAREGKRIMQWDVRFVKTTGSTNEDVTRAGMRGAPAGFTLVADQQTAGRGRMDRKWFSPPDTGLYVSVLVRPEIPAGRAGMLSFCAAVAMRAAVAEAGLPETGIKWPNDLVAGGKKICGILSNCQIREKKLDFAVLGLGVNLRPGSYPPELADRAGCLAEMGAEVDREHLLYQFLRHLDTALSALEAGGAEVLRGLKSHCVTLGSEVLVSGGTALKGVARDIGKNGELIVETAEGTLVPVLAGDVSVRGVMGYV